LSESFKANFGAHWSSLHSVPDPSVFTVQLRQFVGHAGKNTISFTHRITAVPAKDIHLVIAFFYLEDLQEKSGCSQVSKIICNRCILFHIG
jgi:hypothetical protein